MLKNEIVQLKSYDDKTGQEIGNVLPITNSEAVKVENDKNLKEKLTEINKQIKLTNTSLDNKANKDEIFSMDNMGQDIKEAMTGGSVAVVGKNAILNFNIVCGQVTPDKISNKSITIKLSEMEIVHKGKYIDSTGTIQAMEGWNIVKYTLNENVLKFSFDTHSNIDLAVLGELYYNNEKYLTLTSANINKLFAGQNKELLLNHHVDGIIGVKSLNLFYYGNKITNEMNVNLITSDNFYNVGIIKDNILDSSFKDSYAIFEFEIDTEKFDYYFYSNTIGGYRGCLYNNETYLSDIINQENEGKLTIPENCNKIKFNVNVRKDGEKYDYILAKLKPSTNTTTITENKTFPTILNKPYVFTNKKALFVGDSITRGYIQWDIITDDLNYPTLLCNKLGMSCKNSAIGGALFTSEMNKVPTILTQLKGEVLDNYDYIFISGGTNDYGLGATIEQFKTHIKEVCDYLKANFTKEVIFITPINRVAPSNNEKAPLDDYRNIITNYAIDNEFSIIDGKKFGFPKNSTDITYDLLQDELHPSYKGYRHYAKCLCNDLN